MDEVRRCGDSIAVARLEPYLAALAASPNPASALRWTQTPAFVLVRRLALGEIPLDHAALDALEEPASRASAVHFLRAALVEHGVLPRRDEVSAAFARWLANALAAMPEGPDRARIEAYGRWQVARGMASVRPRHAGSAGRVRWARSLVAEPIRLAAWLHAQGASLADLRQDLLDDWLNAGGTARRRVRPFLRWLARDGSLAPLEVAWPVPTVASEALDDAARLALLERLLDEDGLDPRDRFAGALVLLLGQPLTRIVALRGADLIDAPDGTLRLVLGHGSVPLPDALAAIARGLRSGSAGRARTSSGPASPWLLPGYRSGHPLSAERLRLRLRRLGLVARPARRSALLALAARVPAPVLAERLGLGLSRAAEWARAAGTTYADYVGILIREQAGV